MEKYHFYVSNGLWEVVKRLLTIDCEQDPQLHATTFISCCWAMAAAPHQLCFASHILATPWQQSWVIINLLKTCLPSLSDTEFTLEDVEKIRSEVDFQYSLRNFASEEPIKTLFERFSRENFFGHDVENIAINCLNNVMKTCPSTAHCFARQVCHMLSHEAVAVKENSDVSLLLIASLPVPPLYPKVKQIYDGKQRKELFYLLLAKNHGDLVRELEAELRDQNNELALEQLQQLVHNGIEPHSLYRTAVINNRHFILQLLDLLETSPSLPEAHRVPSYLWPLLLLKLWGKPGISELQMHNLINQCQHSTTDQSLIWVCFMLEWYLSFSRWSISQGTEKHVKLEAARDHSVLHLINSSADLAQTDWEQVRALLHEPWDLNLFDAFCAMLLLLRSLLAAASMRHERSRINVSLEMEQTLSEIYQREVTAVLERIGELIQGLRPLRFRLEVLENLFALLFITYEDLMKVNVKPYTELGGFTSSCKGFVATPNILRDTVHLLKDCTAHIEREQKVEIDDETPCSIKTSHMENRLDRLSESLSEAAWRLQLVTGPEFVGAIGSATCCADRYRFQAEWAVETGTEPTKVKRRSCTEKREESGSQSPASGGETDRSVERPSGPGFMNQMLASDWTLVVRCLSLGDLLNAEHIITMMNAEESRQVLEGELNFTRAENDIRQKLVILADSSNRKPELFSKIPKTSLQAVQKAAAQAVSNSAVSSHVERFLSATTLPIIQGSSKVSLGSGSVLQCIENSPATATLDLAMTATKTYQDFKDLVNIAGKCCPELTTRLQSQIAGVVCAKPMGYIAFAQTLMMLLHELNKDLVMPPGVFLRTRHASFSLKVVKDQETLWKTLCSLEKEVIQNERGSSSALKDANKSQKNTKSTQKLFDNLAKVVEAYAETLDLGRSETSQGETGKQVSYIDLLNRYLSDLSTLSDFIQSKSEIEDSITSHSMLKQSAVEVLDRLVFQFNVDPALLEKKAQQLGFNLSASLVWGCAPAVLQGDALPSPEIPPLPESVVLNLVDDVEEVHEEIACDMLQTVTSILTELLKKLECEPQSNDKCCDKYLSSSSLKIASKDASVTKILNKTRILQRMDPPIVTDPDEAFMFHVNLANLMMLHCILHPLTRETFCCEDPLAREAICWFTGYALGKIGFVSIARLRSLLCGEEIGQLFSLRLKPILEIQHDISDPRAVFLLPLLQKSTPGVKISVATAAPRFSQISAVIESFARKYVLFANGTMKIPSLLDWYLDKVLMQEEAEGSTDGVPLQNKRRIQVLLEFLSENSQNEEWLEPLKLAIMSDFNLEVVGNSEYPSLTLSYCDHDKPPQQEIPVRSNVTCHRWRSRPLTESILKQLNQSSRVLSDLVVRLHEAHNDREGDGKNLEVGHDVLLDERLRCLDALLSAPWLANFAPLYDNNSVLASLQKFPVPSILWPYLNACVVDKRWTECCSLLRHLPDFQLQSDAGLRRILDLVLFELASNTLATEDSSGWVYAQQISDLPLRVECVLKNHSLWSANKALKVLTTLLCDEPSLNSNFASELRISIRRIQVFNAICKSCGEFEGKSWFQVYSLSIAQPATVLQALLQSDLVSLFYDWVNLPGVMDSITNLIDAQVIVKLATISPRKLTEISSRVVDLCDEILPQLTSLTAVKSVAELCVKTCNESTRYRGILLGVEMLSVVDQENLSVLLPLVSEPLLIIEQLLMNTRLETLQIVLAKLRQINEENALESRVNELLLEYASRAVQFDVIRVVQSANRENFLVQPIEAQDFLIPREVPAREQWIQDNQVSVCMCCHLVAFSMFNRRHHCRRCGRVICAACSANRIKVDGYKDVPVRVCLNCFSHQLKPEADTTVNVLQEWGESEEPHLWLLSLDPMHNLTVRNEFAFEHSPDATLCLAIFNFISDAPEYTSRLLDESERLLSVIEGGESNGNPEVDYLMLIQIVKSLVLGAKLRYGQAGLTTGVVSCDRLLSQVDVISLLVRNHCTQLIPSDPLTESTMRTLRDRLMEEELWDLAIELSTKAGLPLTGVWAAWGKMLLAAGCWKEARNKFAQCLVPLTQLGRSSPLLDEICDILDSTTFANHSDSHSASEVLEVLGSLKIVSSGKMPVKQSAGPCSPQYFEQEWYLTRYGTPSSLLKFYLRNQQWGVAVNYAIQKQVEPEAFNEFILLPAYRRNMEDAFKKALLAVDPTLENFERYLTAACIFLQKLHCLQYLYDVQLFMQDHIRAAMTCIQLYQSNSHSHLELLQSAEYLHTALRLFEEELNTNSKKVNRLAHVMRMDQKEINKHMNTIWRQLETAKFLANCESSGFSPTDCLRKFSWTKPALPTLFDSMPARSIIASMCITAGKNIEEGFGLSYRIIQDNNLDLFEVWTRVGILLGQQGRVAELAKFADCIKTCGTEESLSICDKVLSESISAGAASGMRQNIDSLVPLISNVDLKVKALTDLHQLKSAYLLAVKHNRVALVEYILDAAERTGQILIRDICRKKLGLASEAASISISSADS